MAGPRFFEVQELGDEGLELDSGKVARRISTLAALMMFLLTPSLTLAATLI